MLNVSRDECMVIVLLMNSAVQYAGMRWTARKIKSRWITARWGLPSSLVSGSIFQRPVSSSGWVPTYEYHWINAQEYVLFRCWNEKKRKTLLWSRVSLKIWIWVDKDTVVSCRTTSPWWCCLNMFTTHTIDAANVTGGTECSNSWVVNMNFAVNLEMSQWIFKGDFGIGV